MKIGSLFDGSGGFPLAASMCGIKPVWASEIEPYPIAVTCSRFPNMKHLGSGTDICAIEDRRNALEFCPICGGSNGLHEFTTENGRNWGCSVCGWEDAT